MIYSEEELNEYIKWICRLKEIWYILTRLMNKDHLDIAKEMSLYGVINRFRETILRRAYDGLIPARTLVEQVLEDLRKEVNESLKFIQENNILLNKNQKKLIEFI